MIWMSEKSRRRPLPLDQASLRQERQYAADRGQPKPGALSVTLASFQHSARLATSSSADDRMLVGSGFHNSMSAARTMTRSNWVHGGSD